MNLSRKACLHPNRSNLINSVPVNSCLALYIDQRNQPSFPPPPGPSISPQNRISEPDNIEALLALYEPEASFNPEPGEEVHGKEAIRQALEGFLAMKPNITLDTKTLAQTAEVALCTAKWHLTGTGPDGPVELDGQSVEVARKQSDGSWLFIIDNPYGLGWE